jgi:hypothetical protein
MRRTHSAPVGGRRKTSPRQRALQVVLRVTVAAGKLGTGQAENRLHLVRRRAARQQRAGDPQIDDTPVRLREAFRDMPSLHPIEVDFDSLCCGDVGRGHQGRSPRVARGVRQGPDGLQQPVGVLRQACTGMHDFHPRCASEDSAPLGLLVGEARQPSQ